MQLIDKDLLSMQEVRELVEAAKAAQQELAQMDQAQVDRIVRAIADAGVRNARRLAQMANEDTGFGIVDDKVIKNIFASRGVYGHIKDMKTIGEISRDDAKRVRTIAVPVGVIAGLIPSTNPTSTALYKAEIAIKAGNAIVFSPHPTALRCIMETVKVIRQAIAEAGGNENLVTYFKSLGYATRAIHPADAANWRRDRVYGQLGFDAFDDISAFEGAETLRGFTTDRETYDYVLDLVEEGTGPQFVFDVTIQNHGGYDTGLVPSDLQVTAPVDGVSFAEVDEYASCLAQSDEDLAYLVERLRALDEPVVVCFFGDHQPAFDDALAEAVYGDAAGAATLEDVQERYAVPYLVWANYDVEDNAAEGTQDEGAAARQGTQATDTSLNYLGAELVRAAGLPTTDYLAFLESLRAAVPALNLNGFMDAEGAWHAFDQKPSSEDARETQNARDLLRGYAIVQYANLFG